MMSVINTLLWTIVIGVSTLTFKANATINTDRFASTISKQLNDVDTENSYPVKSVSSKASLTPLNCINEYPDEPCEINIKVTWPNTVSDSVCLYMQGSVLECWNTQNKQAHQITVTFSRKVLFELKDNQANQIILTTEVKVNSTNNKRRRLRPRWSIF